MRLTNKHVRTHVLVRQDQLQHLQGVFQTFFRLGVPVTFELLWINFRLSCVPRPSRVVLLLFLCTKLYWPTSIGSRACCKYYRLVDPGSIQGSHRPVVNRGGNNETRERSTQLCVYAASLHSSICCLFTPVKFFCSLCVVNSSNWIHSHAAAITHELGSTVVHSTL